MKLPDVLYTSVRFNNLLFLFKLNNTTKLLNLLNQISRDREVPCAAACHLLGDLCNSFHLDKEQKICTIAKLDQLEEVKEEDQVFAFVEIEAFTTLPLCKFGFVLLESKEACVDVNECTQQETLDYCGPNTNCVNTAGSFRCECKVGFEKLVPYEGCSDINECTGNNFVLCGSNYQNCYNTLGSYYCTCIIGWYDWTPSGGCRRDCLGRENLDTDCCTTANPCDYGKGDCDSDAHCKGSLRCKRQNCRDFFSGAGPGSDCCI
ncbi:fibrillin-1 [Eurytemora carolleeae]|uniref:fibrillin-1 n=1 Tax=Eurytemora carolleeae TaxID=1294199 RepID=UPI000C776765|nr:fibrillin-1 [Eurytemora carolleeae]|eukprot:XP_023346081.1 fibrillin-1-like [Eurytemora affinis]